MQRPPSRFELEERIVRSLKTRKGTATAGDVAADTGIPLEHASSVLQEMVRRYKSHLDVDQDGNLLYRFDPALRRRGDEPGWLWHRAKANAWAGFRAFFKAWIMVMLVGYTAAFLLLLLAIGIGAMAAGSSRDDDDRRGGSIGMLPFYLFARAMETLFWINLMQGGMWGHPQDDHQNRSWARKEPKRPDKPVYQRIFQYVFGPEVPRDKLAGERAFARFVRSRLGVVTPAEWVSRTGAPLRDAEDAVTGGMVRFRGQLEASDAGEVVYRFDDLRVTTAGSSLEEELPPVWRRAPRTPAMTGNHGSTNTWITIANAFILFMALMVVTGTILLPYGFVIGLGYVPLAFSTLFFLVPAVRWIVRKKRLADARRDQERHAALEHIFGAAEAQRPFPLDTIPSKLAGRLVTELDGVVEVDEDGRAMARFPRLENQLQAARRAREAASSQAVFGRVIFSSDQARLDLKEADRLDFDERLARELRGRTGEELELEPEPAIAGRRRA